jgi:hypothetical protein
MIHFNKFLKKSTEILCENEKKGTKTCGNSRQTKILTENLHFNGR